MIKYSTSPGITYDGTPLSGTGAGLVSLELTVTDPETGEILPLPPSNNMGGKSPSPLTLSIDWLAFSASEEHLKTLPSLLSKWFECELTFISRPSGKFGYTSSADIVALGSLGKQKLGIIAWGGESQRQRLYVSLTGAGCQSIRSFSLAHRDLQSLEAKITRIDLALDDYEGTYHVLYAYQQYKDGAFTVGGRNPDYKVLGDWLEPTGAGRTLTIGTRGNGKFLRIYEKGRQLGDTTSLWTRWEYELTAKDRIIPLDVLLRPLHYFSGCSPAAAALVAAEPIRIKTTPRKVVEATLERIVSHIKNQSGKAIHILNKVAGHDAETVVKMLSVPGIPSSLKSMPIIHDHEWTQLAINLIERDERQGTLKF